MRVGDQHYRTIWLAEDGWRVNIIDQTLLPHRFDVIALEKLAQAASAISDMWVRGAPLIGVTAAYGVALAMREDAGDEALARAIETLRSTRPTAVNLSWALRSIEQVLLPLRPEEREAAAYLEAGAMADNDVTINTAIGEQGVELIRQHRKEGKPVNILTHCNAGWLATVDRGTALSPIYRAHDAGIPIHVWVDETRPRNQGAFLTAWELNEHGVPHTVIADNAGGHLMQRGLVDMVIVGSDRTTARGDVCNKIGTYLKALAASDNGVPFYVALPGSTIDWSIGDGNAIPIEERGAEEVTHLTGATTSGELATIKVTPDNSPAGNPAFDVTPARLVTGLITERGVCQASAPGLRELYPERIQEEHER